MKYEVMPCVEEDEELVEEKLDAIDSSIVPSDEGAEDEELIFKVADNEGNVIAGCLLEISRWKFAELDIIWVDEKYRKKGLASALIRAAEKTARERDCYTMILGTFDFQAKLPAKAVAAMSNRMELPRQDEGFDELYFVEIKNGNYEISEWRKEK